MAYDPARKKILLSSTDYWANYTTQNLWQFDPATNTWSLLSSIKPARDRSAMAACLNLNADIGAVPGALLFGGATFNDQQSFAFADTWFLDPFPQSVKPSTSPYFRFDAAMAYYPVSGRAVLFGGLNKTLIQADFFGDTWNGVCSGSVWSRATPAHAPAPRASHAMSTGPGGFTVLLFGGEDGKKFYSDTWTWGRAACVPMDGSAIPVGSEVNCQFDPAEGIQFGGWTASGFAPRFRDKLTDTFHTESPGPAAITAQWTDATGAHSQTYNYMISAPHQ